jgi:predicted HTH domain antitoxin
MSRIVDELIEELTKENRLDIARKVISSGKMTLEEIAECTGLSIDEVQALANEA